MGRKTRAKAEEVQCCSCKQEGRLSAQPVLRAVDEFRNELTQLT